MKRKIDDLLTRQKESVRKLESEVKSLKGGKLYVRNKNGRLYFSESVNSKEKGVTKSLERVCRLARQEYVELLLHKENAYCRALEKTAAEARRIDEKYDERQIREKLNVLASRGIDMNRVYFAEDKYEWMNAIYETNSYKSEQLRYVTKCGIRVRSKSERTIADRLTERGIAFRYEMRLDTESGVMYPDFVIRKENGELVIWEHFGLMNKNDYMLDAMKKIVKYRSAGFMQHNNLICTWEEDLENMDAIDEIIVRFILD